MKTAQEMFEVNVFKALDKACEIIVDLNECTNVHAEEYYTCPFREECEEGDVCLSTTEKWKEYLLSEVG